MPCPLIHLSDHLAVYPGPIHVGILHSGGCALLIDLGDGAALDALGELGVGSVDRVVFTHHHRDQACGAPRLGPAVRIGVPAAERPWFDDVAAYWNDPASRWGLMDWHPHHLMLVEPVHVHETYSGGDSFTWGPATITVLDTPGHTDGSVSYVVDVDGRRIVFSGDAIYGPGQVWNIHSLQKGTVTTDYHGFLGARPQLVDSLARIAGTKPDALVPSHGTIMTDPPAAIAALVERLDACYDRYVAIAALRHYFPEMFADYAGRPGHMPIRAGKAPPPCLRHIGTTWVIVAEDRSAFVVDCGDPAAASEVLKLIDSGDIRSVEGIWITHYHFDHTDGVPDLQRAADCPVFADRHVADVVTDPLAWRLTCISRIPVHVDHPTRNGESWRWHEFRMTAYHLPGQTLYHGGLLVEGDGLRMFFAGDSFTMAGIDDYCTHNRNWLGSGTGFEYCLALLARLKPTHTFNQHVDLAFDFTDDEVAAMRANLTEREALFGKLVPWDHANTGMDEPWTRCAPYEQRARAGAQATFDLVVTNHAPEPRDIAARIALPQAWGGGTGDWVRASADAKADGAVRLALRVPPDAPPGRVVIPVDVIYGRWRLPQITETVIAVE